jgi:hypothetical protein
MRTDSDLKFFLTGHAQHLEGPYRAGKTGHVPPAQFNRTSE